jgi:hypothetical protein
MHGEVNADLDIVLGLASLVDYFVAGSDSDTLP